MQSFTLIPFFFLSLVWGLAAAAHAPLATLPPILPINCLLENVQRLRAVNFTASIRGGVVIVERDGDPVELYGYAGQAESGTEMHPLMFAHAGGARYVAPLPGFGPLTAPAEGGDYTLTIEEQG